MTTMILDLLPQTQANRLPTPSKAIPQASVPKTLTLHLPLGDQPTLLRSTN